MCVGVIDPIGIPETFVDIPVAVVIHAVTGFFGNFAAAPTVLFASLDSETGRDLIRTRSGVDDLTILGEVQVTPITAAGVCFGNAVVASLIALACITLRTI